MRYSLTSTLVFIIAVLLVRAIPAHAAYEQYLAPRSACPERVLPGQVLPSRVTGLLTLQRLPALRSGHSTRALNISPSTTMHCLINWARARRHMRAVKTSNILNASSSLKLGQLIQCNEFTHTPCGTAFTNVFQRVGYLHGSWSIGENIAWGTGSYGSTRAIFLAWLNSDGHRRNIFTANWREEGLSRSVAPHYIGYSNAIIWVSEFGRRS